MTHSASFFCLCFLLSNGVFGDTDEVNSVSVMEGDSVTLHTDVIVQRNDQIVWTFGPQGPCIAEIHRQVIDMYGSNVIFGDRLQMDSQTGSLTIRNIRTVHSGLYKLQIFSNRGTSYRRFSVTVYASLPVPVITSNPSKYLSSSSLSSSSSGSSVSTCSLLCSVVNVRHVTLSWYKGNSLLSSISVSDLSISLSLPLQDKNTYSCVLNNPIRNQTKHLDISGLCQTCADVIQQSNLILLTSAGLLMLVIVVVVMGVVIYFHHKNGKQAIPEDLTIRQQSMSEYTQIIYCFQVGDLPQKIIAGCGQN